MSSHVRLHSITDTCPGPRELFLVALAKGITLDFLRARRSAVMVAVRTHLATQGSFGLNVRIHG